MFSAGGTLCAILIYAQISVIASSKLVENEPIVRVHEGQLRGTVEKLVDGSSSYSFKGIPFAAPPVGELRFKVQSTLRGRCSQLSCSSRSTKMQCFVCMAYLMIIATAHPPKIREATKTHEKRSIFNDVIQSLRMRAQIPEEIDINDENNIGQNYEKYSHEPLHLPSDVDFMPRRNDRIEMPSLKYRFPKSLNSNDSETTESPKEEIVLFVNTPVDYEFKPTQRPKKPKPTRPTLSKIKNKDSDEYEDRPFTNSMAGLSQIGDRESQTVVKPTVIVNFRGSVMHRESDIRLERRNNENDTVVPQNIFNIKQEIKLDGASDLSSGGDFKRIPTKVKQDVNVSSRGSQFEEDMMMCETSSSKEKGNRSSRQNDVLQILFTI